MQTIISPNSCFTTINIDRDEFNISQIFGKKIGVDEGLFVREELLTFDEGRGYGLDT
jgi:hypothetical protein